MGYSIDILNNIRSQASGEYQARIPEATKMNILEIGNALQAYTVLYNEFCTALITKIGKTILDQKLFENKLSRFKSGPLTSGQDVEEIFISMAKAEGSFDPDGKNPLGRREMPDVKAIYHRMNRRDKYVITIGDMDFSRVFRSEATLDIFIRGLINSVYSGANYDEWLAMKNLIATYKGYFVVNCPLTVRSSELPEYNGDKMYVVAVITEAGDILILHESNDPNECNAVVAKDFVKRLRKTVMDMSFPSTNFNKSGVMTWTKPDDMVLLINKDLMTEIDVEVLSKAFHIGKTDIQVEIIPMDNFENLADTYAILVDKEWFRIFDIMQKMETQRNADGLFTNYFYHVWQVLSASTFKNAVRFSIGD